MRKIAIAGCGGFGRETGWLIRQINAVTPQWDLAGFYDDASGEKIIDGLPLLGTIDDLNKITTPLDIVIAIGDPAVRKMVHSKITSQHVQYPSLFHPLCQRGDNNNIFGHGCIITSGCIFTTNIKLGDFVIVNLASTIGHDVNIGAFSVIMPNCSISGAVSIGEGCMIGAGVRIIQQITIGNNSVAGAGAVITKSADAGARLIGVPAVNTTSYV